MRSKRIGIINTYQSVAKKNKIVQNKNQASPEAGESSSQVKPGKTSRARPATSRKSAPPRGQKSATAQKAKVTMPSEAGTARPSDEEIRLRAYFISERRRRFALPGDADSDWLEATRQLLSEIGPR